MKNLVLIGSYGSGKTQIAINMAINWLTEYSSWKIALVDLDVVNPYFRSREVAEELEKKGIDMVLPQRDFVLSEAPALPPAISGKLREDNCKVILDVGGDTAGATVLGRYHKEILETETDVWMVVNLYRPGTSSAEEILKTASSLTSISRVNLTGIINNSNLGLETTPNLVEEGFYEIKGASEKLGIPIIMTTVEKKIFSEVKNVLKDDHKAFPLEIYLRPEWYGKGKGGF